MVLEAFQRRARHLAATSRPRPISLQGAIVAFKLADDVMQAALIAAYGSRAAVERYRPDTMHTPEPVRAARAAFLAAGQVHSDAWARQREGQRLQG